MPKTYLTAANLHQCNYFLSLYPVRSQISFNLSQPSMATNATIKAITPIRISRVDRS